MEALINLQQRLQVFGYIAERPLAATLLLMNDLGRPLLLEGEAGVGKTEVAKVLARLNNTDCVRLQCYEGLDVHAAMYEWNYQRQLLAIRLLEEDDRSFEAKERDIFSERYLLKRPLLDSITRERSVVLLIDELDVPTRHSRLICSSCCQISSFPFPNWGRSKHSRVRGWSLPATVHANYLMPYAGAASTTMSSILLSTRNC